MNLNQEIWRSINNFPRYEVSNHGRVRNAFKGNLLKFQNDKDGYKRISLEGIHKRIHRLVAEEFIENNDRSKTLVDHIDRDKANNNVTNLRWVTPQQNSMNREGNTAGSSQYKGVHWNKANKKWRARIMLNGKAFHLGSYSDETEASHAYNKAATEKFGEYGMLNVIE